MDATRNQAVQLLNDAKISDARERARLLEHVAELVVRKEPRLAGEFVAELCEMQVDASLAVRRAVAGYAEEMAAVVPTVAQLQQCVSCVLSLLRDNTTAVVKRSISAMSSIHREVLGRIKGDRSLPPEAKLCWDQCTAARNYIGGFVDSKNASVAVRLLAVRFQETLILQYTGPAMAVVPSHPFLDVDTLRREAVNKANALAALLQQAAREGPGELPSQLAIVAVQACGNVACQRQQFYALLTGAVDAFARSCRSMPEGGLHNSVLHALKNVLSDLLRARLPEAGEWRSQLVEALEGLGAHDVAAEAVRKADKSLRREEALRERQRRAQGSGLDGGMPPGAGEGVSPADTPETGDEDLRQVLSLLATLLEKGEQEALNGFVEKLPGPVLADVVIANMAHLPPGGGLSAPSHPGDARMVEGIIRDLKKKEEGDAEDEDMDEDIEPPPPTPPRASPEPAEDPPAAPAAAPLSSEPEAASVHQPEQKPLGAFEGKAEVSEEPEDSRAQGEASRAGELGPEARPSAPLKPLPELKPLPLSSQAAQAQQRAAVQRLIDGEAPGADSLQALRAALLSKVATLGKEDNAADDMLCEAVVHGPRSMGLELALRWLHRLFLQLCEGSMPATAEELMQGPPPAADPPVSDRAAGDASEEAAGSDLPAPGAPAQTSDPPDQLLGDGGDASRGGDTAGDPPGGARSGGEGSAEAAPDGSGRETQLGDAPAVGETRGETSQVFEEQQAAEEGGDEKAARGEPPNREQEAVQEARMGEARLPEPSQDGKAEEAGGGDASGAAHATQEDPQLGEPFPDGAPQEEEHRGDPTPEEDRDAAGDPTGKETQENGRSFASESADGTAEAAAADPMEVENERGKEEGTQGDPMQTDPAEDTPSAAEVAQDAAARNEGAAPGAGDAGLAGTEADTAWPAAGAEPSAAPEGDNGNGEAAEGREGAGATSGGAAAAPEDDQLTDVPLVEVAGTRYEAVLLRLLRGLREASTPRDPSLIRLLQEAPVLPPESTSEFLASLVALGGQWAVAALKAAFDLLLQRPGLRKTCLRVILETTEAEDADIRNKAVRLIANRLFPERELMPSIEEHAAATLRRAADGDDPSAPQSAEDSARSCELYMALCTKKHILLRGLMETFGKGRPVLCQAIQKQARDLALTIGPSAAVLLSLVRRPPPGSELLLLHMLHVLTEDRLPPWELVAAAMDLYNAPEEEHELSGDVRFLGPVVGGMAQEDVRELLPQILTLGERPLQAAFARLLERRKGADEPLFSPAGLLVAIHDVAPVPASEGGPTLDQVKAGILLCLNNRRLFTKEELALTVQNLRQASTLPTLFMWTVINISRTAPDLVTFILQLLRDMIDKVWSQPQQRQGFVMCCKMMAPQSFPLLSELSPEMLRAAAGRLPRQTLQSLAAFLSSPSCKLPENRRRRAAEIVDAAATAAASGGPAAKAAPPRAEASPAAGSQQSKRPLEGAGEEGGGPNNKAGRHS